MLAVQLLTFIIGIILLIILHEFGHFVAARLLKVEVAEFGLGLPPRIMRLFRFWDTDFTLNAIPLGGFVLPKGENDPNVPGGIAASSPWTRFMVYLAGPAMNLMIGALLAVIVYYNLGKPISNKVLVDQVEPGSPAELAGLKSGDLILKLNETPIDSQEKLISSTNAFLGQPVTLVYQRDGEIKTITLTPRASPPSGQGPMGVRLTNPRAPISLGEAFTSGFSATFTNISEILKLPVRMIEGQASPQEGRLVGYRGMFEIYRSVFNPLWFFMAISISLGVFNLLPIPALDGGRIVMLMPEILFHRRVPPRYEYIINAVSYALLLLLLLYVNVQDFINPIQIPK
jgi:regulator of sigma E protease